MPPPGSDAGVTPHLETILQLVFNLDLSSPPSYVSSPLPPTACTHLGYYPNKFVNEPNVKNAFRVFKPNQTELPPFFAFQTFQTFFAFQTFLREVIF